VGFLQNQYFCDRLYCLGKIAEFGHCFIDFEMLPRVGFWLIRCLSLMGLTETGFWQMGCCGIVFASPKLVYGLWPFGILEGLVFDLGWEYLF